MSRTKNLAELCAHIVDDTFGELCSRIFAALLRRGRLSIPALMQHTQLPTRNIRHGLSVLVREGLVYFNCDKATSITYYEANQDGAYGLLRAGKILGVIHARHGPKAEEVAQKILLFGQIKIGDLDKACDAGTVPKPKGNGVSSDRHDSNGASNGDRNVSNGSFDEALAQLLEAGLVEPVVESMFLSPTDTYNMAEKEILKVHFGGSTKGTKQIAELKSLLSERLRDIRSEGRGWDHSSGIKRKANGTHVNGGEKRRKLANGSSSINASHDEIRLDRNLIIRMNLEKCTVALRTQQLVALAAHDIGETTSQVYSEFLRLLEEKIPRCRRDPTVDEAEDEADAPTVTTMELSQAIDSSINVATGIGKASQDKIDTSGLDEAQPRAKRRHDEAEAESGASSGEEGADGEDNEDVNENGDIPEVDQDFDTLADDPFAEPSSAVRSARPARVTFQDKLPKPAGTEDKQTRLAHIKKHLQLLAGHSRHFLTRCSNSGLGEWTVDFEGLIDYMREIHVDNIIEQDFGKNGHRLARILREKGKLDEKNLPGLALLKQKDVRTKLVEMQMSGFVDIQEIPKDNSRAPGRTIFLWFFDTERVTMLVLDSIYKTMARCYQRLDVEKIKEHDILTLADRSDVRAQEEAMLEPSQLKRLREIREKEARLLVQISRLDELVGTFRDF